MRSIKSDPLLNDLNERIQGHADSFGLTLPEIRFFILEAMEFASLLEKKVYPVSPVNIWEGKNMVNRRFRIESGQESSLFYEVVQTGNPSYAYLNYSNSPMMQASVMAHVCGHCEFSELNVLKDSNRDRTEYVMYLGRKVQRSRRQMGDPLYQQYWNACESAIPLIAPNSRFNLDNAIETESRTGDSSLVPDEEEEVLQSPGAFSHTLDCLLKGGQQESIFKREQRSRLRQETLSRRGYKLRTPCQDILGFLRHYAPTSRGEEGILEYIYTVHATHEFVMRTQIMNEGWAMYWQNRIMHELFRERAVTGIIDYARVFAGVCRPRPYFQRNPYHLGYYLWKHIFELYETGKVTLEYQEETNRQVKEEWDRPNGTEPVAAMRHLVKTVTDYEFLRRFLSPQLIDELYLNRLSKMMAKQLGIKPSDVVREDENYIWLDPEPIKGEMLTFFTHFYRPRIYLIDNDFRDGGLLLFHRDDGRELRQEWIMPTLKNLNLIWKGPVSLVTGDQLHSFAAGKSRVSGVNKIPFAEIVRRLEKDEKVLKI